MAFLSPNQPSENKIKTDWVDTDSIGFYDFNRIEENMYYLWEYLVNKAQYNIPPITIKVDRTMKSVEFLSSINRIEQNLESIRVNFLTTPNYLPIQQWTKEIAVDFNDINRLESNTKELMEYAEKVFQSFRYCGSTITGGGGLY